MLLHLQSGDPTRSRCGKLTTEVTLDKNLVTCRSCTRNYQNGLSARAEGNRIARSQPSFGDAQFPGTGKLVCFHCDRPIREHPVARVCPFPPQRLTG